MSVVYGSTSGVALELEPVTDGTPGIRVTVSGVPSTTTFGLTRLCEGDSLTVQGWRARPITDSDVSVDWAAPLNRPVTYNLTQDGSVVATATMTLPYDSAVIQDPLQPEKWLRVNTLAKEPGALTMRAEALKSIPYASKSNQIMVMGSRLPVAFGGQVQAASKVNSSVSSYDPATAAQFRELAQSTPILLLRTTEDMVPLPAVCYLLADVTEEPVTVHMGGNLTRWQVTGDLVAAVMQAAVSGFITYDDVQQLLAGYTYDDVQAKAAGTTYLDWQKNPLIFSTL